MAAQYVAAVPPGNLVKPEIREYYEKFYQVSDTPDAHQQYSEKFTKDAKLVMASNIAEGREAILEMRIAMWAKVAKRSHKPSQIYSFGQGSDDVMLYGTVDYQLKDGKESLVEWSARSHFVMEDGELKMDFYQVYLDTAAMQKAE